MGLHGELTAPSLEQAVKNHRKVVRAAIRLRHSVAADNELAVVMPRLEAKLALMLHQGAIPALSLAEVEGLLDEA